MTFFPGIQEIISSNPDLINVIEVEPQTIWFQTESDSSYRINDDMIEAISSYDCYKTIHSVDCPVGGSNSMEYLEIPFLASVAQKLRPPLMSEHLSFNRADDDTERFKTGIFLPPCQSKEGVDGVVKSIKTLTDLIQIPFAVENGVNYLRPQEGEMTDGEFLRQITERANCGILLDLHNLWCNELNGRQKVLDFINEIPLERVLELHFAGGFAEDGFWLDAHSGEIPIELVKLSHTILPKLPNLRAMIFEIEWSYVPIVGIKVLSYQLKALHDLWNFYQQTKRENSYSERYHRFQRNFPNPNRDSSIKPTEWEKVLGSLVLGKDVSGSLAEILSRDPGTAIYRKLIRSNRAAMIVGAFPLTSKLLITVLGSKYFHLLIADFLKRVLPSHFALREGEKFVNYIISLDLDVLYLNDIIQLERAFHSAVIKNKTLKVFLSHDPLPIVRSLIDFRKPGNFKAGNFEVNVGPEFVGNILNNDINLK